MHSSECCHYFCLHGEMKRHWSRLNLWEALGASQISHVTSVHSFPNANKKKCTSILNWILYRSTSSAYIDQKLPQMLPNRKGWNIETLEFRGQKSRSQYNVGKSLYLYTCHIENTIEIKPLGIYWSNLAQMMSMMSGWILLSLRSWIPG